MTETRRRIAQPISFTPEHHRALEWLAAEAGDTNRSGAVRRLIEAAMRERFGPNWIDTIDEQAETKTEAQAVA